MQHTSELQLSEILKKESAIRPLITKKVKEYLIKKAEIIQNTTVDIKRSMGKLSVIITTPRLRARPIQRDDVKFMHESLFGDAKVMTLFANGTTKTREWVQKRVVGVETDPCNRSWVARWEKLDEPGSAMVVEDKATHEKLGYIIVGGGELAGISKKYRDQCDQNGQRVKVWGHGYGIEIGIALVHVAIPKLRALNDRYYRKVTIRKRDSLSRKITETTYPIDSVYATVRCDNMASRISSARMGLLPDPTSSPTQKLGAWRLKVIKPMQALDEAYSKRLSQQMSASSQLNQKPNRKVIDNTAPCPRDTDTKSTSLSL